MFYLEKKSHVMARRVSVAAVSAALSMLAGAAHADSWTDMFTVSGFGTVGAVHSSSTNGDYVISSNEASGAGRSANWALGVDSKLGVQLNGNFTNQLSGVVQVIVQDQTNNTFGPRFEWANLQYAITPDLKVRVGRVALPTFMVSDTRMVGFANPWIRPPIETYQMVTVTNSDGVDASYKMHFGSVTDTVQVLDGRTSLDVANGDGSVTRDIVIRQIEGINDTFEFGALTARVGLVRGNLALNLAPGYSVISPLRLINLGAIYDPGNWFVQAEVSKSQLPGLITNEQSFYVTAGYRLNSFTPYATYSQTKPENGPPAFVSYDQKTTSVGIRWDAMKNIDVKLQLDRVSLGSGNTGHFIDAMPGLAGSTVNVASVALDFVF